jgi:hypothetical protein
VVQQHFIEPDFGRLEQAPVSLGWFASAFVVPESVGVRDEDERVL